MDKIKRIIKKILKIILISFVVLFILLSINNCNNINKGKKVATEEIINNIYVDKEEEMYLFLFATNGRIQRINENNSYEVISFTFVIDNGVISCTSTNNTTPELKEFSLIVLKDSSLYCKYFNEILYKVENEV